MLDKSTRDWSDIVSARYYVYPIHPSFMYLEMPSLTEALYWVLILFLHHRYEDAAKIITTVCQTDQPLTKEQKWIIETDPKDFEVNSYYYDMHPMHMLAAYYST
jgi:hypothetical protein